MSVGTTEETEIHDDLRASELREGQLWFLTLGLLILFGLGAVAGFYVLLDAQIGDAAARHAATRLLIGLALLILLFCAHILHVRTSVSRIKLFLNEMNGMATGNLEVRDCLAAIARGMAKTYRTPLSRILILRSTEPAIEVVSTHAPAVVAAQPADGISHALSDLRILRETLESIGSRLLHREEIRALAHDSAERKILTGGLPGIGMVLILPLRTQSKTVGVVILGFRRPIWRSSLHPRVVSTAHTLARHAGRVVEEVVRRREAIRDPLTDLYNRRHFKERIGQEIARASRDGSMLAVLLCDLDRFKEINDTRGHPFGDIVLKSVATAIRAATRGTDLQFRWGGDEIVVVLSNTTADGVLVVAERIRNAVARYAESERLQLDASIGIALYPKHGENEEDLVHAADLAMYVAKRSGDKVRVGVEEYNIDERCVKFVYQPICGIDSGETLGHEVFTRDPDGHLGPLDLFRKYRSVGQLGRLKRVIFEMQIGQAREAGVLRLFLNADLDFLNRSDPVPLTPGMEVVVELSELDPNPHTEDRLTAFRKWRAAGYRFAVDDFGAGFVSLPILAQLEPDYVKIDRSSIVHALDSPQYREFFRHLVRAAGEYTAGGIVAEGIERDVELEVARELGIPYAQGYLLGRPVGTVSELTRT